MKRLAILSAIALSGLIYNTADAQIRIHLGLDLRPRRVVYTQPVVVEQAPVYQETEQVYNDNNDDDYYYLPDVDAYYDVTQQCYYYNDGNNWISAAYLPGAYRNYDWRNVRRYEVHEHRPFMRNDFYRSRYNGHEVAEWRHNNDNHFNGGDRYAGHFNRDNDRRDDRHFDNRGQNGYSQPVYQNNNRERDNRGNDHYAQNSRPQTSHRMGRYSF